jgi:hypothetical protein
VISEELRARFAAAAKAVADEGERVAPITPGSDTAIALGRLCAGLPGFLADRHQAKQTDRDAA